MVHHRSLSEQSRFASVFTSLKIGKLLRDAGIRNHLASLHSRYFSCSFSLVFEGKNWFRMLESSRGTSLPGKDVIYREALTRKPDAVVGLIQRALRAGFRADTITELQTDVCLFLGKIR